MKYVERPPCPQLAPWVECIWTLHGDSNGADPVLPDGRTEIVVNLGDPFLRHHEQGVERQAHAVFAGPATRAVILEPSGSVDVVGIRLRPAAAAVVLRASMAALADHIPPLDAIAPQLGNISERVAEARNADLLLRIDSAEAAMLAALRHVPIPDVRLAAAVNQILATNGAGPLDHAARAACWSPRQLQRRFLHDVGVGPKSFARVLRLQAAARAAPLAARVGWARVAVQCGYFDQAHLIRDLRKVTGRTPTDFFRSEHPLSAAFLNR